MGDSVVAYLLRALLEVEVELEEEVAVTGARPRSALRRYQNTLVRLIKQCWADDPASRLPGLLLALEPGAGKTGTVLTALRDLLDEGRIKKALIVGSVFVAQTVWPDEMEDWDHLRDTTWTLIRVEDDDLETNAAGDAAYAEALADYQKRFDDEVRDAMFLGGPKSTALNHVRGRWQDEARAKQSPEDREKKRKPRSTPSDLAEVVRQEVVVAAKEAKLRRLVAEDTEIHIINKEALPWLWDHFRKGKDWPYQVIVTDDLREGRSGKKRSKGKETTDLLQAKKAAPLSRFGVLAAARKRIHAMIELTGTPTPKGLENVWGLAYLIDLGHRLGLSKTKYLERWFFTNQYSRKTKPFEHSFNEIMGLVKDIMFSLDPEDMPELPPFIIDPIKVRLPAKVLEEYKRFEREMVSEEYDVEAVNGGVLHGKLLQFANGSMYQEDGSDIPIHDAKIEALKDLVERLDGTPLLVGYTYQFDVDRICAAFPNAVVLGPHNSRQVIKDWNADKIELLLAHRASAGHGLNAQKGSGHMCEYGLTSDAELFLQFVKRLHRPGRRFPVFNHVIIAEGTIDEDVYPMYLDPKIETQNRILESIRLRVDSE